jgi:hypothetical protein
VRNYFTLCLIALVMVGGTGLRARTIDPDGRPGPTRVAGPHVRGTTTRMTEMLTDAVKRSPTFAALIRALDNTDVIVHVEEVRQLPVGVDGRLTFVHAAGGVRYLRAQILGGRGGIDTMSTVGHELQHALEVAMEPNVRDLASFATLYMQIGDQPIRSDRFDTAAARETGRRVRNEMN